MNASGILATLRGVTAERDARLLHACESGSRAWGFASPDSDWDVRFLYVHELDWYLRVAPGTDQLQRMLPGDLDLSGWELRKALGLFAKGNVPLFEHLGSPIQYHDGPLAADLRALIPSFFNPIGAGHHYLGLARRTIERHFTDGAGSIKKLFYVLRPLCAVAWIGERGSMPPTSFVDTLAGIAIDAADRARIEDWLAAKVEAREADAAGLSEQDRRWLVDRYQAMVEVAAQLPQRPAVEERSLDQILRRYVFEGSAR